MEYAAIAIGLLGLFFAWRSAGKVKYLQERLDSANNRYFTLVNQVSELEETLQRDLLDLRVELKRQAGLLKFEPQMTIGEITAMHPRAAEVLAGFHLGGCSSCAVSPDQTLSAAAHQHNLNLDMLLGSLRQLAGSPGPQPAAHGLSTDPDLRLVA